MMRPLSKLVLTAAALAVTAGSAAAQRPQLGIGGGVAVPTGDLGQAQSAGWHGQISMGYRPPMFPLGFRVDGLYHDMAGDVPSAASFRTAAVTGNVVLEAPALAVRPYLIGGVGYYNTKFQGLASRDGLGFNGGVGLKFRLADLESFVEARYHTALNAIGPDGNERSASFVPITFGVSF